MTDLNSFSSTGSLPIWALPNAPDISQWSWQPPKPDLWSSLPPSPPAPVMDTAPETSEQPSPLDPAVANQKHEVQFDVNNRSLAWGGLRRELRDLHISHFGTAKDYRDGFKRFSRTFALAVKRGELSGTATAELCMAAQQHLEVACRVFPELDNLFAYLMSAVTRGIDFAVENNRSFCIPAPQFWETFSARMDGHGLTRPFIFALRNTHSRHNRRALEVAYSEIDRYFQLWRGATIHGRPQVWDWAEIAQISHMASIWAGRADKLIKAAQTALAKGQIERARHTLEIARKCVRRVQRFTLKKASLMSDDERLTAEIAKTLKKMRLSNHRIFYRQATALLGKANTWSRVHYNWLQTLARLPEIRTPDFKRLLQLFPARGYAALSHTELCHLLLLHWDSQGLLQDAERTRHIWKTIESGGDGHTSLAALALAVSKSNSPRTCTAVFWGFWDILQDRAGRKTLLRQLWQLSRRQKLSPPFLQRLAWSSNDHRTALMIHHILVRRMGTRYKFWWPPFWDKFAAKFSSGWKWPLIDPMQIVSKYLAPNTDSEKHPVHHFTNDWLDRTVEPDYLRQLNEVETESLDRQIASYHPTTAKVNKQWELQVHRLKNALQLLKVARQITDRQALHYVTIITSVLADKQGFLEARDLATLTSVIMRTLDQGKCGSLQRFRWYLEVIYHQLGENACRRVGMILKGRRQANWRLWQMRLSITKRKLRRERDFGRRLGRQLLAEAKSEKMDRLWLTWIYANRRRAIRQRKTTRSRLRDKFAAEDERIAFNAMLEQSPKETKYEGASF